MIVRPRSMIIFSIGMVFILLSVYFWDNIPDYGSTSSYYYEPMYHYSRYSQGIGSFIIVLGIIVYSRDYYTPFRNSNKTGEKDD